MHHSLEKKNDIEDHMRKALPIFISQLGLLSSATRTTENTILNDETD